MLIKKPTLFKRLMMKLRLKMSRTKAQKYKIISKKGIYKVVLVTATDKDKDKDTNINISTSFEDAGNLTKLSEESGIAEADLVNYVETKALGCIEYRKELSLPEKAEYENERVSQESISNKTIRTKRATKSEYLTQFLAQGSEKIIPYATFFTRNSAERFKEFISTSMERGMSIANM